MKQGQTVETQELRISQNCRNRFGQLGKNVENSV